MKREKSIKTLLLDILWVLIVYGLIISVVYVHVQKLHADEIKIINFVKPCEIEVKLKHLKKRKDKWPGIKDTKLSPYKNFSNFS